MKDEDKDIYSQVTQRIITDLENGVPPWRKPWSGGDPGIPMRYNAIAYRGINVLLLWLEAFQRGYASPIWMTYKQANIEGGKVRRGERGSMVVFASPYGIVETNDKGEKIEKTIRLLRRYTVFNVEQIDGLPEKYCPPPAETLPAEKRIGIAEAFVKATGAIVRHGGSRACYSPAKDLIQMPPFERFKDAESYYATLLHELTHWTRHETRLKRDFGQKKRGDAGYAAEELVAEIGAAFLCAMIGITRAIREDHAAYIRHWLGILKEDSRAIFRAATHAQQAADYLMCLQPKQSQTEHSGTSEEPGAEALVSENTKDQTPSAPSKPVRQRRRCRREPKLAPV